MTSPPSPNANPWPLLGPLMVAAGAIAVGYAPIGLRLSEFGPQATAFWRFLIALPLLAILAFSFEGGIRRPSIYSLLTGLFFALDIAFWHAALVRTSVANATFIVNLGAIAVGLIAWLALKERPSRLWPIAAIVAVAGAWLLSSGASKGGVGNLEGDLLACIAASALAFYFLFAKLARRKESPINVLFWATVVEVAVSLSAALLTGEQLAPPSLSWFIAPISLAIVAHAAGQALIIAGFGRTTAGLGGLLILLQPITSALAAAGLFHENLGEIQLAGAALILAGVWLAGRR